MIGQKLAHYEIVARIGEGGMGEVFRARDTKLGREVALKLLPPEFTTDRERLARFRREARTLASLNHPNIASIHDIDEADGKVFLTMELVEGLDLAERLRSGPLPVSEAIRLATQLAEGLRQAHEKRIVHRDLKPANVKVTPDGELKILDFGLARAWQGDEEGEENLQNSPTITAAVTHQGVILGTAAYMSPEQAKGRVVDHRADIWAFGAILWEMLSGQQLFEGDSVSDTLAAVLRAEPDESQLPSSTPVRIRQLLRLCLERDRKRRLQDIGDTRLFLEEGALDLVDATPETPTAGRMPWRAIAIGLAAVSAVLAFLALRPTGEVSDREPEPLRRWYFEPERTEVVQSTRPMISPDGESIAYVEDAGISVRELDELEPRVLEDTKEASLVFWSPDSQWVGFVQDRRILRVARTGGQITPIGAFGGGARAAGGSSSTVTWDDEDRIVIGTGTAGLLHVPSAGAQVETLVPPAGDETDFHEVAAIPGGRGWVFVVHDAGGYDTLGYAAPDGTRRELIDLAGTDLDGVCVDPAGYLLFRREGMNDGIWAVAFSIERLEVTGTPFIVAADGGNPSVSNTGTLVYELGGGDIDGEMVWLDRAGNTIERLGTVRTTRPFPNLTPDRSEFVLCVNEEAGRDIWRFDAESGLGRRVASTEVAEEIALISPDGTWMYSYAAGDSGYAISRHPVNRPTESEFVAVGIMPEPRPDLGGMFYAHQKPGAFDFDIGFVEIDDSGPGEPRIVFEADGVQWDPNVSPDGKFLLFTSDESGRDEVYLTELPEARGLWKVSTDGGQWGRWRSDGREIYYASGQTIYATEFEGDAGVRLGIPKQLFTYNSTRWSSQWANGYDVDAEGERFLVLRRAAGLGVLRPKVIVVENWASEFEKD